MSLLDIEAGLRGFSCPQIEFDDDLLNDVAVEYAKGIVERFVRIYGDQLMKDNSGLIEIFSSWLERDVSFDQTWEPVFGTLGEVIQNRSAVDTQEAAARLALVIQEQGTPGEWKIRLNKPANLRWNRWQLADDVVELSVSSNGTDANIETTNKDGANCTHMASLLSNSWTVTNAVEFPQVQLERRTSTLLRGAGIRSAELSFLEEDVANSPSDQELVERFSAATDLLRRYAPEYLRWVDRVMRYIIPLKGGPDRIVSGSTRGQCGVSHISSDAGAAEIAEMLVHESAHQYYYLITRLQPVHDGSDKELYYSPIKQRGRPIYFIHLAYHAFANVLLLGRKCRLGGYNDPGGYFANNEKTLVPQLAKLEEALKTTSSLTPVGFALWKPLSERVQAI